MRGEADDAGANAGRRGGRSPATRPTRQGGRPAAFLDRDGTIIEHVHYLTDPRLVRLLPGAAEAIRALRDAGFACVVVTNQSAVGRGMLTADGLGLIHDEMRRLLAAEGAAVDAIYYCPEAPTEGDPTAVEHPDRKPGPGMLFRAAEGLGLDLDASWMVGDLLSDVLTGVNAGCRGSVLLGAAGDDGRTAEGVEYHLADDLLAAARLILAAAGTEETTETNR